MASKSMAGESARIPHRAKLNSEVGDLRADIDDSFERFEGLVGWPRILTVPGGAILSIGGSPVAATVVGVNLLQGQEKASLTIGAGDAGLTFVANRPGTPGNSISVEVKDSGGVGGLAVTVPSANEIVIDFDGATPTALEVQTAYNLVADAVALASCNLEGTGGDPAVLAAAANLAGGVGAGFEMYLGGENGDVVLTGEVTDTEIPLEFNTSGATIGDVKEFLVVSDGVAAPPVGVQIVA